MRIIIVRILFWLLKVDLKTKNIVPFDDLKSIAGAEKATEIDLQLRKDKYMRALASAYNVQGLVEWMYLQVVTKRNEHLKSLNKDKKEFQLCAVLTFLKIIEEMREANNEIINKRKK